MKKCLEGSHAVALTVNACKPKVVSAYPITPQTHIVEDLSKLLNDGKADFEFVRAESEFAAASMVLGASATGVRTYSATSSQGLLLMTEVLFTIAGMRLPVVMTCANRAVSAPINIWNDQQDSLTVRDSGWIMLYAEDNQEAVDLHPLAFKVAEKLRIPVMVNMDGFILTHTFETVSLPGEKELKKYLGIYKGEKGQILDINNPVTLGAFATPEHYLEIREDLQLDMLASLKTLKAEAKNYKNIFGQGSDKFVEYYGAKNAKVVFVAMGSVLGTIRETVDELNKSGKPAGVVKIKCFRPLPSADLIKALSPFKKIAVIDKAISLGNEGIVATEIKAVLQGTKKDITSVVAGLGGRDITREKLKIVYQKVLTGESGLMFLN